MDLAVLVAGRLGTSDAVANQQGIRRNRLTSGLSTLRWSSVLYIHSVLNTRPFDELGNYQGLPVPLMLCLPVPLMLREPVPLMLCEPVPLMLCDPVPLMLCEPVPLMLCDPVPLMLCEPVPLMLCEPVPLML